MSEVSDRTEVWTATEAEAESGAETGADAAPTQESRPGAAGRPDTSGHAVSESPAGAADETRQLPGTPVAPVTQVMPVAPVTQVTPVTPATQSAPIMPATEPVAPDEPTTAPDEPTTAPDEPTTAPDEPTAAVGPTAPERQQPEAEPCGPGAVPAEPDVASAEPAEPAAEAEAARPVAAPASEPSPAPPGPLPLPLLETAALAGEYRWIEHALYVLLGHWAEEAPLASVRVHLDAQGMRHAWHADLWADRLPVLGGTDPDRLTVPSTATAALFRLLGAVVPPAAAAALRARDAGLSLSIPDYAAPERPGTLPRLAGLYRVVLPRLVASYERHLAVASEPTDGPVIRALRLVLNDEEEDWRVGESLVQRLVTSPHDVAVVTDYQRRLEAALVSAGARTGLVQVPGPDPGR